MKTARFLFTLAGFGALALGASFAGDPSQPPAGPAPAADHADAKPSKAKDDSHASEKSAPAGPTKKAIPALRPGPDRSQPVATSHAAPGQRRVDNAQAKHAPLTVLHQPGLNQPVPAARWGVLMNTTETQRHLPALSPPPSHFTALPVHQAPGRSAAPASLGGLAAASAKKSAAAINGAEMKPKP